MGEDARRSSTRLRSRLPRSGRDAGCFLLQADCVIAARLAESISEPFRILCTVTETKTPVDAFVEEYFHETASTIRALASSRNAMTWSRDTEGKAFEKIIDGLARFQIVQQRSHRHPGAMEYDRSAHDVGAARDDRLFHGLACTRRIGAP